ncbi:S1 family peptidase [Streptomyces sp. ACA25]|uniref:S1 family peptidase n=1 Tax=Streptomyces sp. ACA25 TaxID=3022596 RepID=UPI002306E514|nr:S1 family peptidase [Streptomyces sp. ACA25]MDB1089108.1 S1 family peptidase [Streptomyces sp. ACA25]
MTHRRIPQRRAVIAASSVAALMAGTFLATQAGASTPAPASAPDTLSSSAAGELAETLASGLQSDQNSMYYDAEARTLVVNVTDEAEAAEIQEAGAEARVVEYDAAELDTVMAEVDAFAVPGTARAIDPATNSVRITVDSTVTGEALAEVEAAAEALGDKASVEKVQGEFETFIMGGDAIYSSGSRCSLGFNVTVDGQPHFLTAGHCGSTGSGWAGASGGSQIGQMTGSTFPGADHALVRYTGSVDHPSAVNLYSGTRNITGAGNATVGQAVERSGSTTGRHSGTVTGLNATVTYPQGTVRGLIQTNVCAEPGDSGGALFAGSTALGLTSGGSGNCSSGGTTFFEPVTRALDAYNATLP